MQYRQHCASNLIVGTLLMTALGSYDIATPVRYMFAISFMLATFLLSPDLDLFHSSPNKNWGYIRVIWWPYTKIFRHRGLSHAPILGTWTRLVYLLVFAFMGFLIYDIVEHYPSPDLSSLAYQRIEETREYAVSNQNLVLAGVSGVTAADLIHLLVDKISSFFKKIKY